MISRVDLASHSLVWHKVTPDLGNWCGARLVLDSSSNVYFCFDVAHKAFFHIVDAEGNKVVQKRFTIHTGEVITVEDIRITSGFLYFYGTLRGDSTKVGSNF